MVFSNTRGLPVGVGGSGGILWIAFLARAETFSEVDHSSSIRARLPSGSIVIRSSRDMITG